MTNWNFWGSNCSIDGYHNVSDCFLLNLKLHKRHSNEKKKLIDFLLNTYDRILILIISLMKPACIIGLAGTTNTGSVDDLITLRKIADDLKVWFHIDAAYGEGTLISERKKGLLKGIETGDSITIDPHKWFFAPLMRELFLLKMHQ